MAVRLGTAMKQVFSLWAVAAIAGIAVAQSEKNAAIATKLGPADFHDVIMGFRVARTLP
jgi:hypothetical protein